MIALSIVEESGSLSSDHHHHRRRNSSNIDHGPVVSCRPFGHLIHRDTSSLDNNKVELVLFHLGPSVKRCRTDFPPPSIHTHRANSLNDDHIHSNCALTYSCLLIRRLDLNGSPV